MKKYALLVLRGGGNKVIAETHAASLADASAYFNQTVTLVSDSKTGATEPLGLDAYGYRKGDPQVGDSVTYCIAEYLQS